MTNLGKSTLGRKSAHRQALLIQGANALIRHKSIFTTKVKAKMVTRYIAPIITKARKHAESNFLHAKRRAFSLLRDKKTVQMLFSDILPRVGDRNGGYTRIITLENRPGSDKSFVLLELVDYNMLYKKTTKAKSTRRSRKKAKSELEGVASVAIDQKNVDHSTNAKELTKEPTKEVTKVSEQVSQPDAKKANDDLVASKSSDKS